LPYHIVIKAGVHYKQTQRCYIIATVVNIAISILTVHWFGLIGVAVGTLVAMAYQTVWMAWYDSQNIISWPFNKFLKQLGVDAIVFCCGFFASKIFSISSLTYISWVVMAVKVVLLWGVIAIIINCIFYKSMMATLFKRILSKIKVIR
jgi:O-antigen/teichoic acid export membrane protein